MKAQKNHSKVNSKSNSIFKIASTAYGFPSVQFSNAVRCIYNKRAFPLNSFTENLLKIADKTTLQAYSLFAGTSTSYPKTLDKTDLKTFAIACGFSLEQQATDGFITIPFTYRPKEEKKAGRETSESKALALMGTSEAAQKWGKKISLKLKSVLNRDVQIMFITEYLGGRDNKELHSKHLHGIALVCPEELTVKRIRKNGVTVQTSPFNLAFHLLNDEIGKGKKISHMTIHTSLSKKNELIGSNGVCETVRYWAGIYPTKKLSFQKFSNKNLTPDKLFFCSKKTRDKAKATYQKLIGNSSNRQALKQIFDQWQEEQRLELEQEEIARKRRRMAADFLKSKIDDPTEVNSIIEAKKFIQSQVPKIENAIVELKAIAAQPIPDGLPTRHRQKLEKQQQQFKYEITHGNLSYIVAKVIIRKLFNHGGEGLYPHVTSFFGYDDFKGDFKTTITRTVQQLITV